MTDTPKLNAVNYHVVFTRFFGNLHRLTISPLLYVCQYENYCILFHPKTQLPWTIRECYNNTVRASRKRWEW